MCSYCRSRFLLQDFWGIGITSPVREVAYPTRPGDMHHPRRMRPDGAPAVRQGRWAR